MSNHFLSISLVAFFVCVIVSLLGCQKAPELTLTSPANVELSVDGSSGSITFTANRDWRVNCSDPWVSVSPSSGPASDGPVTVTVRCGANTTYDDRTATVTITMEGLSQTVTVKQPANLGIVVPTQLYNVAPESKTIEVEVQANVQYNVTISTDWIRQVGTKGLTTNKLTFNVEENKTYDERSATITISGSGISQVITVKQSGKEKPKVPDGAVDLGLSVFWASCNLGASSQEEYGNYYAWGETETKEEYSPFTYKWYNSTNQHYTKYVFDDGYDYAGPVDGKQKLDIEDDAANRILGGNWRMPTKEELESLIDATDKDAVVINGVYCIRLTSKIEGYKNNSIIIPISGRYYYTDHELDGWCGYFWSSSLAHSRSPYALSVETRMEPIAGWVCTNRWIGIPIRPVTE